MKVRAKRLGFFGATRRREGEVFDIPSEKQFSKLWMEKVEEPAVVKGKAKAKADVKPELDVSVPVTGDAEVI